MKSKILIITVFLFQVNLCSIGQNVFPSYSDSAKWSVLFDLSAGGGPAWTEVYEYITDTNVCGYDYSFIRINGFDLFVRSDSERTYIRLDTLCNNPEHLLYDYSRAVGDTFDFPYFRNKMSQDSLKMTITGIDTIMLAGVQRIKYRISFRGFWGLWIWNNMVWIKGFGSLKHPFYYMYNITIPNSQTMRILCYDSSSVSLYMNPSYNNCDVSYHIGIAEYYASRFVEFYPNPFASEINIDFIQDIAIKVELLSIQGKVLYYLRPVNKHTKILLDNEFNKGIYLLRFQFEEAIENIPIIKI